MNENVEIKTDDYVLYEEPAKFSENDMPTINMIFVQVKYICENNKGFVDTKDVLRELYRCRYIFKDGTRVDNPLYDFNKILNDEKYICKKEDGK